MLLFLLYYTIYKDCTKNYTDHKFHVSTMYYTVENYGTINILADWKYNNRNKLKNFHKASLSVEVGLRRTEKYSHRRSYI